MQPLIGVSTEYSSNPYLLGAGEHSVNDVALLLNDPVMYDLDSAHYAFTPSVRYSDSGSYASLNSNYVHLSGSAQFTSDLDSLAFSASFGRDSSLYQNGLSNGGVGVRSDASSAGIDWQRAATERAQLELYASWSRVLYGQGGQTEELVDYRYVSEGCALAYAYTERDKIKVVGGAGQYIALDGLTKSDNLSGQIEWDRRLTEIWTMMTSLGYAKSNDAEKFFLGPYYIGTIETQQKGSVYSAILARQGELLNLSASASRAYRPSGFEFLSRQDIAELNASYTLSERWSFGAKGNFTRIVTPVTNSAPASQRYVSGRVSADWHLTPAWVVSLQASWVSLKYQAPPLSAASSGIALEISRQFPRIDL